MPAEPWFLDGFLVHVDDWIEREGPDAGLRATVLAWIQSRMDDPYDRARREPGFENLWFAVVPGTEHADGLVVTCSFRIFERHHAVRCDQIAALAWPL